MTVGIYEETYVNTKYNFTNIERNNYYLKFQYDHQLVVHHQLQLKLYILI